jgi:2,3-bisphosphoglycerate-dependent phosphoglycerate mutase
VRPGILALLRHGQSPTNASGIFTGWLDVGLTARGRRDARRAGRLLALGGVFPDVAYTSVLRRAIETADLVLAQVQTAAVPVERTWRLNERHYGALTGQSKARIRDEAGESRFAQWRNSLTVAPPALTPSQSAVLGARGWPTAELESTRILAESLGDVVARVRPYWEEVIAPQIASGQSVLVVAHGNSLRALITVLDALSQAEVSQLRMATGLPLLYTFTDGLVPTRRGGRKLGQTSSAGPVASFPAASRGR